MVVEATSPDGLIAAKMTGRNRFELRFRPGAYGRYSAESIAPQLAQLATSMWVGYRRGYFQALSEARGETISGPGPARSLAEERFRAEQAALELDGSSPHGWVAVRSVGLMRWRFRIEPGFERALYEDEFLGEVGGAVRGLLDDYFEKVRQLQVKYFDLKLAESDQAAQAGWR